MNLQLLTIGLLLFIVSIMYINLTSTTTDCLRESSLKSSINLDPTILYINLILAILLLLASIICIYNGIYSTLTSNIQNNNLDFLIK